MDSTILPIQAHLAVNVLRVFNEDDISEVRRHER